MVLARARVAMTSFNSAQNKPNAMTCSTSGLTLAALTSQTMPIISIYPVISVAALESTLLGEDLYNYF